MSNNDIQLNQQKSGTVNRINTLDQLKLAVIDLKTTGFSVKDRVIEFACITVVDGKIVDEYDTLIQPEMYVNSPHNHGITPDMLQSAPDFQTVAADIATKLDGSILAAHNLPFQQRMLQQEINRLGEEAAFSPGQGICTYMMTRQKLAIAASMAQLPDTDHTAKGDAYTVASLIAIYNANVSRSTLKAASFISQGSPSGIIAQRSNAPTHGTLREIANNTSWPGTTEDAHVLYLEALDHCLDDLVLDASETAWLDATAASLNISDAVREDLHVRYFTLLIEEIESDGVVTEDERDLAIQVAGALGMTL